MRVACISADTADVPLGDLFGLTQRCMTSDLLMVFIRTNHFLCPTFIQDAVHKVTSPSDIVQWLFPETLRNEMKLLVRFPRAELDSKNMP